MVFIENHLIPAILIQFISQMYSILHWLIDALNLRYILIKILYLLFHSDNQKLLSQTAAQAEFIAFVQMLLTVKFT